MSRPNPISTIVRNWKKTIFIVPAFAATMYYTVDYTNTLSLMKTSCKQVSRLGDQRLRNFNAETRHITVILNPVAGKRKAKKLYSKWVEPLLHLSGIKVSLVETDSPNQAADLMRVMSNCDGVAIVGGDGTVHEAINGLLSRDDTTKAAQQFPIAIIPVGQFNSIARMIYSDLRYRNYKEFLILSTLNLIESKTRKFDLLKINSLANESARGETTSSSNEQTHKEAAIYAMRDVRYGKYQDNYYKTSGYMIYQEYIKPYWLRLRRAFGGPYSKPQIESIAYTEPCVGCTKCFEKHKFRDPAQLDSQTDNSVNSNPNSRWWTGLIRMSKQNTPPPKTADELEELWTKNENPNCDTWLRLEDVEPISEFRACLMNEKKIRLSLARDGEYQPSEVIEVQDVKIKLDPQLDKKYCEDQVAKESGQEDADEQKKNVAQKAKKDTKDKIFIDRQPVEAHSIQITTLSKAIRIFTH